MATSNSEILHAIENSVSTMQLVAQSIKPIVNKIIDYAIQNHLEVATMRQLEITKQALDILEEEAKKLMVLYNQLPN